MENMVVTVDVLVNFGVDAESQKKFGMLYKEEFGTTPTQTQLKQYVTEWFNSSVESMIDVVKDSWKEDLEDELLPADAQEQ